MSWDLQRKPAREAGSQGADAEHDDEVDNKQERDRARRVSRSLLHAEVAKSQGQRGRGTSPPLIEGAAAGERQSQAVSPPDHDRVQPPSRDTHDQLHDHALPLDNAGSAIQLKVAAGLHSKAPHKTSSATASTQSTSGQVRTIETTLEFSGVAGRATLGRGVTIVNDSSQYIGGMPRIEGQDAKAPAFSIGAGKNGFIAPPERDNKDREIVSVRYLAPTPGSHTATLVLPTELGELRVALHGQALDIGRHARTLGDGQAPEPVHDVSDKKPTNRSEGRAQAMDAADAVSSLARTTEGILTGGDGAREQFGARLLAAGASLNTRILGWVHEEGLHRVESIRQDSQGGAADFIKYVAGKAVGTTLKVLSKENILTAYAFEAVDLGLSIYFGRTANQQTDSRASDYGKHMGDIMGFAIPATDAATRAMALRFAELMGRYDVARATLIDIAGVRAQHCIAKLLAPHDADGLDVLTSSIEDARELLHAFKRTQESWAQALKQMAAAAINAQSVVDSGFSRLLEKYIEFRAAGNREIADDERTVSCHGFIDFGEPWNIQHTGFTFGKFSDASSTVQGQIDQKRLTDLGFQRGNPPRSGWKVDISLTDVNKQGSVILKQGSAGPHEREHKIEGAIEDRLRAVGGIEEIWRRFDSVTLGTHVIWGNKH